MWESIGRYASSILHAESVGTASVGDHGQMDRAMSSRSTRDLIRPQGPRSSITSNSDGDALSAASGWWPRQPSHQLVHEDTVELGSRLLEPQFSPQPLSASSGLIASGLTTSDTETLDRIQLNIDSVLPENNLNNRAKIQEILAQLGKNFFSEKTTRVCGAWVRNPLDPTAIYASANAQLYAQQTIMQRCQRYGEIFWAGVGRPVIWPIEASIAWFARAALKNTLVALPRSWYVGVNAIFAVPLGIQMALHGYCMFHKNVWGGEPSTRREVIWALALAGVYWMIQGTPAGAPTLPLYVHIVARQILREVCGLSIPGCKVPHLVAVPDFSDQVFRAGVQKKLLSLPMLEKQESNYRDASLAALSNFMDALQAVYRVNRPSDYSFNTQDTLNEILDFKELISGLLHPYTCAPDEFVNWGGSATHMVKDAIADIRGTIDEIKNELENNAILSEEAQGNIEALLEQLNQDFLRALPRMSGISSELKYCIANQNINSEAFNAINNLKISQVNLIKQLFYKHIFRDAYASALAPVMPNNVHETDESRGSTAAWCLGIAALVASWYYWNPQIVPYEPKSAKPLGFIESWFLSAQKDKPGIIEWGLYKFWVLPNFEYVNIFASSLAELCAQLMRMTRTLFLYGFGGRTLIQLSSAKHQQSFESTAIQRFFTDKLINSGMPGFSYKTDKIRSGWQSIRCGKSNYVTQGAETDASRIDRIKIYWLRAFRYAALPFVFSLQAMKCLLPKQWPSAHPDWHSYKTGMLDIFNKIPGSEEMAYRQTAYNFVIPGAYRAYLLIYMGIVEWCKDKWVDLAIRQYMANRIANTIAATPAFVYADSVTEALSKFWSVLALGVSRADALPLNESQVEPELHTARQRVERLASEEIVTNIDDNVGIVNEIGSSQGQRTWSGWFTGTGLASPGLNSA